MSHLTQPAVPRSAPRSADRSSVIGGMLGLLALALLVLGLTTADPDGRTRGTAAAEPTPRIVGAGAAVGVRPAVTGPDESAVAAALGVRPAVTGPDESAVAAALASR